MIELRDYQKKAVRELKQKMIDMLNDSEDRQKLIFKAPTGAGKTVMVSTLLDELTRDLPMNGQCRYSRVAWVWIAPNKLHSRVIAPCAISLVNEGRCVLLCLMSVIMWMVCILAMCSF